MRHDEDATRHTTKLLVLLEQATTSSSTPLEDNQLSLLAVLEYLSIARMDPLELRQKWEKLEQLRGAAPRVSKLPDERHRRLSEAQEALQERLVRYRETLDHLREFNACHSEILEAMETDLAEAKPDLAEAKPSNEPDDWDRNVQDCNYAASRCGFDAKIVVELVDRLESDDPYVECPDRAQRERLRLLVESHPDDEAKIRLLDLRE